MNTAAPSAEFHYKGMNLRFSDVQIIPYRTLVVLFDDLEHDRTVLESVFFQNLVLDMIPFKGLFIVCYFLLNKL